MRALPPLGGLKAFEAAARLGSFRAAAGELGVTSGAISQQVKGLETRLGVRLFDRGAHSLALTIAGQQYLPALRDAFDAIAMATAGLASASAPAVVELAVPAIFAAGWLLPRLDRFQVAHRNVELRLRNSNRLLTAGADDVGAAIRHGRAGWPEWGCVYLFGDALVPVCSPEGANDLGTPGLSPHRAARGGGSRRHSGRTLEGAVLLETGAERPPGGPAELARDGMTPWAEWQAVVGIAGKPRQRLVLGDEGLIVQAALNGLGLALVDQHVVEGPLRQGRLVVPFDVAPWRRGTAWYLVHSQARAHDEGFRAVWTWLLEEAGGVSM